MATADRRSTLFGDRVPNSGDDMDSGFRKGSVWIYNDRAFFCTDSVSGDATWVEIGLGAQSPYVLTLAGSSLNPAAGGQTYYMAQVFDLAPVSTSANRLFTFGVAGTIVAATVTVNVGGTLGLGQGGNGKIALLNTATLAVSDLILNQQYGAVSNNTVNVDLNVPIQVGQTYSLVIATPSFTTAPTTTRHQVNLYIRPAL